MTKQEASKIIFTMRATYPGTYKNMPAALVEEQVQVWAAVFADVPYSTISAALMAYIRGADSSFPPQPSDINRLIVVETSAQKQTPLEAWAKVYKAICNSGYNSETEFAKLDPLSQRAIGTAANLREMSQMPIETVESVEQSHFIRAYQQLVERSERESLIPEPMRQAIKIETSDRKELTGE